jgi:drug/metabolite transporter (DMT)-like permease
VLAVGLGLAAAVCWGLADFLGGLFTRRITLATVLLVSQLAGLTAVAVVVAVGGFDVPAAGDLAPALIAGVSQLVGIAALYAALAIGTMSVISPISASGAAVLTVVVALATGDRPAALQFAGMAAALAGAVLATRSATGGAEAGDGGRRALALSAIAALGFGGFYVGMAEAVDSVEPFWALLAARATAAAVLVAALAALRPRVDAGRADLAPLVLIGLLDVGANACFTLGADTGLLSVVAVLASLYPVTTVLLARARLGERLTPVQTAGVGVALAGVALIAAG